jgi:hypothetical protein
MSYSPPPNRKTAKAIAITGKMRFDGPVVVSVRYSLFSENENDDIPFLTDFDIWLFSGFDQVLSNILGPLACQWVHGNLT